MADLILDGYERFVKSKRRSEVATGHKPGELNEHIFDFQHAIVSWAVRRGRAAIFADTGLGKTLMQLACLNIEDATKEQCGLFEQIKEAA